MSTRKVTLKSCDTIVDVGPSPLLLSVSPPPFPPLLSVYFLHDVCSCETLLDLGPFRRTFAAQKSVNAVGPYGRKLPCALLSR